MTPRTFVCGLVLIALTVCASRAADVAIVHDGQSDYTIVTPAQPTPAEQLAADELAKYLKLMSGAALQVAQAGQGQGKSIILREFGHHLAPGLMEASAARHPDTPDDFAVHIYGDNIVIEGGSGRGVLYGTYRLLESLGCRFLAPQLDFYRGSAEVIPAIKTLSIAGDAWPNQWISPRLKLRKIYVEEGHSHNEQNLKQMIEWMPKAGFNTLVVPANYQGAGRVMWDNWRVALTPELQKRGMIIEVGGHGYQNFINADMPSPGGGGTLFEKHPDWFAQNDRGERQSKANWVFNTANDDAVTFMVGNVVKYIQERPEIKVFDLWPPDGERWDESQAGQAQGTPTDRMVMLTNKVNRAVHQVRPDVRIECIAYARYTDPPATQKLDKDVLVDFCPIAQEFDRQINDPASERNRGYADDVTAWRQAFDGDISIYSYYRKYAWQSLPVMIPHYMQRDIRWYVSLPLQGISSYAEPGDWFTYELNHWMLARLAWDPRADVDALMKQFAEARYGAAGAAAAVGVYNALEETIRTVGATPHTSLKSPEQTRQGQALLDKAVDALKQAAGHAETDAQRQNVARLLLVAERGQRDLAIQSLRAEHKPDTEIRKAVEGLHQFILQHRDAGVFLVHGTRLSLDRLLAQYAIKGE